MFVWFGFVNALVRTHVRGAGASLSFHGSERRLLGNDADIMTAVPLRPTQNMPSETLSAAALSTPRPPGFLVGFSLGFIRKDS